MGASSQWKFSEGSKTVLSVSVLASLVAASSAFSCVSCVNHCVSDSHESSTKFSNSEASFSSEPSAQSDKSSSSPKLVRESPPLWYHRYYLHFQS